MMANKKQIVAVVLMWCRLLTSRWCGSYLHL